MQRTTFDYSIELPQNDTLHALYGEASEHGRFRGIVNATTPETAVISFAQRNYTAEYREPILTELRKLSGGNIGQYAALVDYGAIYTAVEGRGNDHTYRSGRRVTLGHAELVS